MILNAELSEKLSREPAPLVATVEGGKLRIDGDDVGQHPYRKSLRNRIAYYPTGTAHRKIETYMGEQDTAYVGSSRGYPSFSFYDDAGHHGMKIAPAGMWGVESKTPSTVQTKLERLQEAVHGEGWKWGKAVSSVAGRVCREYATELRQLPARWRPLSHAAIHQGPTVCLTGGAPWGRSWDRKQAFLRALFAPMPIRGSWIALPQGTPWRRLQGKQGMIRATVWIDPERMGTHLPPLPVRNMGATVYPAGMVRGVWTLSMLQDAIENDGVELRQVHEVMVCRTEPIHAWAGERIAQVQDKGLQKLLYTRYWGRLASIGGWRGSQVEPDAPPGSVHRFDGSDLYWLWEGYGPESFDCAPDYRPDHAAFIAGLNHQRMNEEVRRVPRDRLIACHVDAIWTDDPEWTPGGRDFAQKGEGETRFYGVGTYRCGEKMGAQGFQDELTRESLEEHGRTIRNPLSARAWIFGESPAETMGARSFPPRWDVRDLPPLPEVDLYDPKWTAHGWVKRDPGADAEVERPREDVE